MNRSKIGLVLLAVIVVITGFVIINRLIHPPTTAVKIELSSADTQNLSATLDNQPIRLALPSVTVAAKKGDHSLVVKKTGFNDFSTNFTVQLDQPLTINITLNRITNPVLNDLSGVQPSTKTADWKLTNVQYFGSHDWVFVNVDSLVGANPAFFIARYDDAKHAWVVVDGPETTVASEALDQFPTDLRTYLQDNNHVIEVS